jgi:hypothetical protein
MPDHPLALVTLQVTGALRGKPSPVKYMVAVQSIPNGVVDQAPTWQVHAWGLDLS